AAPFKVADFKTGTYWRGIDVQGNYIYLSGGENLRIIDGTDLTHPTSVSYLEGGNYDCEDVVVREHFAYLAASHHGLEIIDITAPANPVIIGQTSASGWSEDVTIHGNYAYLADDEKGLRIVDITLPQTPMDIGQYATKSRTSSVAVQPPYAFVADYDSGLCIVNIADPRQPVFVTQIKSTYYTMGVAVREQTIFIADGNSLRIFDISNIHQPLLIGECPIYGFARQIEVAGNYAFVANGTGGAAVFDISNLQTPNRIGYYKTGDDVQDIAVRDNLIFALDGMVGLYIIRFDAPAAVAAPEPGLPAPFQLAQNYPNPFNPATQIHYHLPQSIRVILKIYNVQGQEIQTLVHEFQTAGMKSVTWDGRDHLGRKVPAGIYVYRLLAGQWSEAKKMLLIQ
ncbi:T9SS type A sorting domain-containing protein, partial [candidate division KSB1 bacterium]|nr:T9SS type A sorting domain-containing protein [candidate division KSB1 bacterium]